MELPLNVATHIAMYSNVLYLKEQSPVFSLLKAAE